jgi:hypothetical protein
MCAEVMEEELMKFYKKKVTVDVDEIMPTYKLSRDLAALYSDMSLSDVELEVEGKILKAHKNILWSNLH